MSEPTSPAPLDYAPADHRRRRYLIRGTIILSLSILFWAIGHFGPAIWASMRHQYWLYQCRHFSPPSGTIVYQRVTPGQTLPTPAGYLDLHMPGVGANGPFAQDRNAMFIPRCCVELGKRPQIVQGNPYFPVVFCHELISLSKHHRLALVDFAPYSNNRVAFAASFYPRVCDETGGNLPPQLPRNLLTPLPLNIEVNIEEFEDLPAPIAVYAGQPDPADASKFTIPYRWPDGVTGTIDGQLLDDDTITLHIRPGPGDLLSAASHAAPK